MGPGATLRSILDLKPHEIRALGLPPRNNVKQRL